MVGFGAQRPKKSMAWYRAGSGAKHRCNGNLNVQRGHCQLEYWQGGPVFRLIADEGGVVESWTNLC